MDAYKLEMGNADVSDQFCLVYYSEQVRAEPGMVVVFFLRRLGVAVTHTHVSYLKYTQRRSILQGGSSQGMDT